jgi:hypothetical protein
LATAGKLDDGQRRVGVRGVMAAEPVMTAKCGSARAERWRRSRMTKGGRVLDPPLQRQNRARAGRLGVGRNRRAVLRREKRRVKGGVGDGGGGFAIDSLGDRIDMAGLPLLVRGVNFDTSILPGVLVGLRIRVEFRRVQEQGSVGFMER